MLAHDLIVWTQALLLSGELAKAEPKRLRYRLLHVAARLAFHGRPREASPPARLALGGATDRRLPEAQRTPRRHRLTAPSSQPHDQSALPGHSRDHCCPHPSPQPPTTPPPARSQRRLNRERGFTSPVTPGTQPDRHLHAPTARSGLGRSRATKPRSAGSLGLRLRHGAARPYLASPRGTVGFRPKRHRTDSADCPTGTTARALRVGTFSAH
jgi:hypothetical protein